jgi:hypothetical protein
MKTLTIGLLLLFLSTNHTGDQRRIGKRFDYQTQIGILSRGLGDHDFCLAIQNAVLTEGALVYIISIGEPPLVSRGLVTRKLDGGCLKDINKVEGDSFYELKEVKGERIESGPAFAVVDVGGTVKRTGEANGLDLEGDGQEETFRVCTSREGLHLTVWSGRPIVDLRKWHRYYYLGYDVESNCTKKDY